MRMCPKREGLLLEPRGIDERSRETKRPGAPNWLTE